MFRLFWLTENSEEQYFVSKIQTQLGKYWKPLIKYR